MMPRASRPPAQAVELYWTIKHVAERLHCSRTSVNDWIASGKLKKMKLGAKTLITESALQQFIADQNQAA